MTKHIPSAVLLITLAFTAGRAWGFSIEFPGPEELIQRPQERILVKINGSPVTTITLVRRAGRQLEALLARREMAIEAGAWNAANQQAFATAWDHVLKSTLQAIVQEEIVYQRAKKKGIQPMPSVIEREFQHRLERMGGAEGLAAIGATEKDLKEEVKRQIAIEYVMATERPEGLPPSPKEVEQFYRQHEDEFRLEGPAVKLRMIVFPAVKRDLEQRSTVKDPEAAERAEKIMEELAAGAEFAALARKHSADIITSRAGGLYTRRLPCGVILGIVPLEELNEDIARRVPALEAGKPAGPFRDGPYLVILLLEERFEEGPLPFSVVRPAIQQFLANRNQQEASLNWFKRLMDKSLITDRQGDRVPSEFLLDASAPELQEGG